MAEVILHEKWYQMDIDGLRLALNSGNRVGYITISLRLTPLSAPIARVVMDCHTLYIVGFLGAGGDWWHFNDEQMPTVEGPWKKLPISGRHDSIGTDKVGCILYGGQQDTLDMLGNYAGGSADSLKPAFIFIVVLVSESIRSQTVNRNARGVLSNVSYSTYSDCGNFMKNWSKHTKSDSSDIRVPWKE